MYCTVRLSDNYKVYKSSAVAEMGDRGHNRHRPKRGGCCAVPLLRSAGNPSNKMWPVVVGTDIPMRRVASYTIVAIRLDG